MATKNAIDVRPLNISECHFTIVGDTPLIVHAWDEKSKRQMFERQTGKKLGAKHDVKIPLNDYKNSLYWLTPMPEDGKDDAEAEANIQKAFDEGAKFAFKCDGIKQSIISGAYWAGLDVTKTTLKSTFFICGDTEASTTDFAEIVGDYPTCRQDMVRVGGMSKSADIRYRAEFAAGWRIPLKMLYNKDGKYTLQQLLNMVNYGGFCCGIGEWRPEKDGQFGMYHIESAD